MNYKNFTMSRHQNEYLVNIEIRHPYAENIVNSFIDDIHNAGGTVQLFETGRGKRGIRMDITPPENMNVEDELYKLDHQITTRVPKDHQAEQAVGDRPNGAKAFRGFLVIVILLVLAYFLIPPEFQESILNLLR